jgi:exosortase D (VPLPA-CTERM-specific)
MSFGFLFAALYRGPVWHKLILFLSTVPITIAMNSVRIGIIGLLVDRYGIAQAEGFLHFFEGWVIFVVCVILLYFGAFLLQRLVRNPRPIHSMLDVDFRSLQTQLRRFLTIRPSPALIGVCGIVLIAGLAANFMPSRTAVAPERQPFVLFPLSIGEWHGQSQLLDRDVEQVLNADDYLKADFVDGVPGLGINLFVAYYDSLVDGGALHSPEQCIPGGGWEVSGWSTVNTGVTGPSGEPLSVNRAVIRKGPNRQLVYFWFDLHGRTLTSTVATKVYTFVDMTTRQRADGALVRLVTPIAPNETESAADERLREFLLPVLNEIQAYLPS